MKWRVNPPGPGRPRGVKGKRVHVILNNGYTTEDKFSNGWPADEKGGCNWEQSGHPFEIKEFAIIGDDQ